MSMAPKQFMFVLLGGPTKIKKIRLALPPRDVSLSPVVTAIAVGVSVVISIVIVGPTLCCGFPSGIMRSRWNDTERFSMALVQFLRILLG